MRDMNENMDELSHPPSQPRPRASRPGADAGSEGDAPPRAQLVAMGLLGLVLVAVPLYLWRRPHAVAGDPVAASGEESTEDAPPAAAVAAPKVEGPTAPRIVVGTARVLECHDRGSHRTAPADCDRLPGFEKQLEGAIAAQGSCVPRAAGGGTLAYVADVSYGRKKKPVAITASKDAGTLKSAQVASACASAVAHALSGATLDEQHAHARYKIEVIATYP